MELNRENFRAMIYYDFRRGLTQQQCADQLALTFGDEAPHRATVFRWFAEFNRGRRSLKEEFREGRPKSVVL
ncbi:Histone-lysine N-methyltransferase SETMAR [Camponotus japonicus]